MSRSRKPKRKSRVARSFFSAHSRSYKPAHDLTFLDSPLLHVASICCLAFKDNPGGDVGASCDAIERCIEDQRLGHNTPPNMARPSDPWLSTAYWALIAGAYYGTSKIETFLTSLDQARIAASELPWYVRLRLDFVYAVVLFEIDPPVECLTRIRLLLNQHSFGYLDLPDLILHDLLYKLCRNSRSAHTILKGLANHSSPSVRFNCRIASYLESVWDWRLDKCDTLPDGPLDSELEMASDFWHHSVFHFGLFTSEDGDETLLKRTKMYVAKKGVPVSHKLAILTRSLHEAETAFTNRKVQLETYLFVLSQMLHFCMMLPCSRYLSEGLNSALRIIRVIGTESTKLLDFAVMLSNSELATPKFPFLSEFEMRARKLSQITRDPAHSNEHQSRGNSHIPRSLQMVQSSVILEEGPGPLGTIVRWDHRTDVRRVSTRAAIVSVNKPLVEALSIWSFYGDHVLITRVMDAKEVSYQFCDENKIPEIPERPLCMCSADQSWTPLTWLNNGDLRDWLLPADFPCDGIRPIILSCSSLISEFPWNAGQIDGRSLIELGPIQEVCYVPERPLHPVKAAIRLFYLSDFHGKHQRELGTPTVSFGERSKLIPSRSGHLESVKIECDLLAQQYSGQSGPLTLENLTQSIGTPGITVISTHSQRHPTLENGDWLVNSHFEIDGAFLPWDDVVLKMEDHMHPISAVVFSSCESLDLAREAVISGCPWAIGFRGQVDDYEMPDFLSLLVPHLMNSPDRPAEALRFACIEAKSRNIAVSIWGNAMCVVTAAGPPV